VEEILRGVAADIGNESLEAVGSRFEARSVCLEEHGNSRCEVYRAQPAAARKGEEPRFRRRIQISEATGRKRETLEHESRAGDEQGSCGGQLAWRRTALALICA
jgi:hypothetical protein